MKTIHTPLKIKTIQAVEKPKTFNDWINKIWDYNKKDWITPKKGYKKP